MKMTLTDNYGKTVTIEVEEELCHIEDYLNKLVIPILRSEGFSEFTLGKYLVSDELPTKKECRRHLEWILNNAKLH